MSNEKAYEVRLLSQAEAYYKKASSKIAKGLERCFEDLEKGNFLKQSRIKKLKGYDEVYRYRVGQLRVFFEIKENVLLVLVIGIWSRGDAYKKMKTK